MSSSEFCKIATVGDSNIPVPRRTHAGSRRSKGCNQLPELQKYIETIIKASSECESEGASLSEKGEKFPRGKKLGKHSVFKGTGYPAKHEKVKFHVQVTACKSKNKAKAPCPEAVSSGDEIPNKIVYTDFEDPRNWKTDDQNPGSKSEFGNFLKQFFPNPYHLGNINEFKNDNSDISPEKKQEDDLGDETLAQVPISDVRTETEVESEKTNNAFVTADSEIKPCKRGSDVNCRIGAASSLEQCIRPESRMGGCRESNVGFNRMSVPSKTSLRNRSSYSTLNVSSQGSSLESVSEVFGGQDRSVVPKKSSRTISNAASQKSSQNEMKLNSSGEDFSEEGVSDYDIGKLKLLSMTDSDDSFSKNLEQNKDVCDDYLRQTPSTAFDDIYESNDFKDLREIFEVMNKATESFLELSLKTDRKAVLDIPQDTPESDKLLEFITQLSEKEPTGQESARDNNKVQQDEREGEKSEKCCIREEETEREKEGEEDDRANSEEVEKRKASEGSLANLLLSGENPEKIKSAKPEEEKTWNDSQEGLDNEGEQEGSLGGPEEETNTCFILSDLEQTDSAEEDQEAGQKIDEVLQFMYDCLKKFGNQDRENSEEAENYLREDAKEIEKSEEDLTNASHEKTEPPQLPNGSNTPGAEEPGESLFVESYPRVKEIQCESSTFLEESKRKPVVRGRCRKRQGKNSPLVPADMAPPAGRLPPTGRELEAHSGPDSTPPVVQTVEGQNELGSYSEQPLRSSIGCSDSPTVKSILPHSVKLKKGKTDTHKTIKDALDTEEKLLANYLSSKSPEKKAAEKAGDSKTRKPGNHVVVRSGRATAYPFLNDFRRSNSNFVICVSSLPRNLRTMAANRTSLTLSPSISLSLSNVGKTWDIKPLPYYQKLSLKRIPVIFDVTQSVLERSCLVRQGVLLTVRKNHVEYVARPVCLGRTVSCAKSEEELSLKNSECLISIRVKPMKKSLFVESSGATGCLIQPFGVPGANFTDGSIGAETEGSQRVDCLLESLEKTEGRLMLLEQNEFIASESLSSCSANETYKCDNSDIDWEGESGHERVHDLLLRTYSLQQKLHRYLYKMTCFKPAPLICPLTRQECCSHLGVVVTDQIDFKILPEKKASRPEETTKTVTEETTTVEVQTSDHAFSCGSPSGQSKQTCENSTEPETKDVEEEPDTKNEDDDNSSVCSFKSSNDFSESNEIANPDNKPKSQEKARSGEFLKKIFSEIESFRQSFKTVDKDNVCVSVESNHESSENLKENTLTEYDPKMPAKVLKTVFKGQKSMTELTIGLKDVPMTQVSNISVEKRKFSPNHTKISICILKEKPEAGEKANAQDSVFKANSNVPHKKFSTLYFDQIRPSLSRCQTEYFRMEDDLSKTSESPIENSEDDDDDDFKSVASSLSSPEVAGDQKEAKDDARTSSPPRPPKTFTKYRFDFYRKMDMSLEGSPSKPKSVSSTVCRYKELEPLKEALTEMQIRMRSIKQDTFYNSNDYYERALRLAKMSAGYCQSCGNRAVIPKDTFGYYKTLLPRRYTSHRHSRPCRMAATPTPGYYSVRSMNRDLGDNFCDLDVKRSSSYLSSHKTRPGGAFLRNSLHDMPVLIERM